MGSERRCPDCFQYLDTMCICRTPRPAFTERQRRVFAERVLVWSVYKQNLPVCAFTEDGAPVIAADWPDLSDLNTLHEAAERSGVLRHLAKRSDDGYEYLLSLDKSGNFWFTGTAPTYPAALADALRRLAGISDEEWNA